MTGITGVIVGGKVCCRFDFTVVDSRQGVSKRAIGHESELALDQAAMLARGVRLG